MPTTFVTDADRIPDTVVEALGMPKKEISFVGDHPDGTLAGTKDGNVYIIRDGLYDADGNTVVQLYVQAHPKSKLPMDTYRPAASDDIGVPLAQPVAPEVALALAWRQQQLDEAAKRDGLELPEPQPVVVDPSVEASAAALVTDAGPKVAEGEVVNENPADQKPDEPTDPQPADEVVKTARSKQAAERAPKPKD